MATADVKVALTRAQKKFEQFDVNLNGTLEAQELLKLADWVFESFHPDGEALSEEQKQAESQKLLSRLDQNDDGVMDFEEFTGWFERTCESINKFRRARATKLKAPPAAKPTAQPAARPALPPFAAPARPEEAPQGHSTPQPRAASPRESPRALFVTTPGRSPRAMMPAGTRANTVLNAARGIFDAANKNLNDVLEVNELTFLVKEVWRVRGLANQSEQQLRSEVDAALVQYGTGEQFVTFMQFLRMVTKHPWHLLLPSDLQAQLGVTSPSKGLPITPRDRDSPQPGGSPSQPSSSGPLQHDDLALSQATPARSPPAKVPGLELGSIGGTLEMQELLPGAKQMFERLDTNHSGSLEQDELLALADWVFANFHPGGEPMPEEKRRAEADKLLGRMDKNEDKQLSFEEFEAWMKRTSASIEAFRNKRQSPTQAPAKQAWGYTGAELSKPEQLEHMQGGPDIPQSMALWNSAASHLQTIYQAAEELFRKYSSGDCGLLTAENLLAMVQDKWAEQNTPMPKKDQERVLGTAQAAVQQADKLGLGGIGLPGFTRMVTKKPWKEILPAHARLAMQTFVHRVMPDTHSSTRRPTRGRPSQADNQQLVKRVTAAIQQLFVSIVGSAGGVMDAAMLLQFAERACGKDARNLEQFSRSVMALCDRVVQGGLCMADFTRVAVREPFCGLLPPSILQDVYTLMDRAMGGAVPARPPAPAPAPAPAPMHVQAPSDTIEECDQHLEQARRELCRMARANGLRSVFERYDADQNGFIDGREFISLARELARKMASDPRGRLSESAARTAIYTIMRRIDCNQDGRISFKEFEDFVTANMPGAPGHAPPQEQRSSRRDKLTAVFEAFDINGDGTIGYDELLALGQARRRLGQKQGEWTADMNRRMLARMDSNGDGRVVMNEFVSFFDDLLPSNNKEFETNVNQFIQVADAVRKAPAPAPASPSPAPAPRPARAPRPVLEPYKPPARAVRPPPAIPSGLIPGELEASGTATLAQKNARIDMLHLRRNRTPEETAELKRLEAAVNNRMSQLNKVPPKPSSSPASSKELRAAKTARMEQTFNKPSPTRVPRKFAVSSLSDRERRLQQVFEAFDINGDGTIGADELLALGKQRRKLGQKTGEWTVEMNNRLMTKLDRDGDGKVQRREFVDFFDEQLPSVPDMFKHHCEAFLKVAESLRAGAAPRAAGGTGRVRAMQEAISKMSSSEQVDEQEAERLTAGLFSKAEAQGFEAKVEAEFNQWDSNQDGVIDKQEFTKMRAAAAYQEAERIREEAKSTGLGRSGGKVEAMKEAMARATEQPQQEEEDEDIYGMGTLSD